MRGLVLTKNTVIRVLNDRNIIHRVGLSVFIAMTDKSLDLPFSFSMSLFSSAVLHPPSIFLICLSFPCVDGAQLGYLPACVSMSLSVCRMSAAPKKKSKNVFC